MIIQPLHTQKMNERVRERKAEWLKTLKDCADLEEENQGLRECLNDGDDDDDDESFNVSTTSSHGNEMIGDEENFKKKWLKALEDAAEMEVENDSLKEQLEKEKSRSKRFMKINDDMSRELRERTKETSDRNRPVDVDVKTFSESVSSLECLTKAEKEKLTELRRVSSSGTSIDVALNTLVVLSESLSRLEQSEMSLERHLMYREDQDSQTYELRVLQLELEKLRTKWEKASSSDTLVYTAPPTISGGGNRPSACSPRKRRPSVKSTCRRSGWLLKSNWWNRSGTISATIGPSTIRRRLSSTSSISGSSSPAATAIWNKVTGAATNVLRPERKRYFILDDCSLTLRYFLEKPPTNWRDLKCERGIIALQDLSDVSMYDGNDDDDDDDISFTLTTKRGRVYVSYTNPSFSFFNSTFFFILQHTLQTQNGTTHVRYGLKAANSKEAHAWYMDLIDCMRGCDGAPVSDYASLGERTPSKQKDEKMEDEDEDSDENEEEERTKRAMQEAERQHQELERLIRSSNESPKQKNVRLFEMSKVSVWPKQSHTVRVPVGDLDAKFGRFVAVKWSFETKSYDISFHVRFVPFGKKKELFMNSTNTQRVPSHRTPQTGTFRIPSGNARGHVVLYWSNHYSRLRRKELRYRVDIIS